MKLGKIRIWDIEDIRRADDQPYLYRIGIFRCPWFSLMLHIFSASDDDCLHDHPWAYKSFMLKGGYFEQTTDGELTWYGPGSFISRPANWLHRVVLAQGDKAWTLVFTSGRERDWGFQTPNGWVHHSQYTSGACSADNT